MTHASRLPLPEVNDFAAQPVHLGVAPDGLQRAGSPHTHVTVVRSTRRIKRRASAEPPSLAYFACSDVGKLALGVERGHDLDDVVDGRGPDGVADESPSVPRREELARDFLDGPDEHERSGEQIAH